MGPFFTIVLLVSLAYAGMAGYLYFNQRNILYLPEKALKSPMEYGLTGFEEIKLRTSDAFALVAWYSPPVLDKPTIVYFHGNAGHIGDRSTKLAHFQKEGWGIMAVSYRGYGNSEGTPSETGLFEDARTGLNYIIKSRNIPVEKVALYGESLGSGVAVQMATEFPGLKAVILEAPYTSVADRAAELYPYIPARTLLKDHFNSLEKIRNVKAPVMIIHGTEDLTIPVHHGQAIFGHANEPKKAYFLPGIGHTDFNVEVITQYVREAL